MGFKSVFKVDVDKGQFDAFKSEFEKFDAMLAKMPAAWSESGRAMAAATMAMAGINQQMAKEEKEKAKAAKEDQDLIKKQAQESAAYWKDIGHSTDRVLTNISGITRHFLSWSALTGVFTGLLGVGSLFGLDRMAGNVGSQRVQAAGLGVSTAEQRAFDINYRRLLASPEGLLSNVANAKSDWSKRGYFGVLGVNDIDKKDPAQLSIELVERAAKIFAKNPTKQYADATGLSNFFSMEDLRSLLAGNRGAAAAGYGRDVGRLGYDDSSAEKWQEFSIKMSEASARLESSLVNGLSDLAPQLGKLTDSLAHLVDVASHSPKVREWIDDIVGALDRLAKWLDNSSSGGSFFTGPVANFARGNGPEILSSAAAGMAVAGPPGAMAAVIGDGIANAKIIPHAEDRQYSAWQRLLLTVGSPHNPGNLRKWGDTPTFKGFARFNSDEDGERALGKQLLLFNDRDHLNTIRSIIGKYAPPNENDTEGYIKKVSQGMGAKDSDHLDLHNTATLAQLMLAIIKRETGGRYGADKDTLIKIMNGTGNNVTVNANQAAGNSK